MLSSNAFKYVFFISSYNYCQPVFHILLLSSLPIQMVLILPFRDWVASPSPQVVQNLPHTVPCRTDKSQLAAHALVNGTAQFGEHTLAWVQKQYSFSYAPC